MPDPTPLQLRTAQLREAHLQRQIGHLVVAMAGLEAERDALAEQNAQLMAELAKAQEEARFHGVIERPKVAS